MYVLAEILFLPRLSVWFGAGSGQVIRDKGQRDEGSMGLVKSSKEVGGCVERK